MRPWTFFDENIFVRENSRIVPYLDVKGVIWGIGDPFSLVAAHRAAAWMDVPPNRELISPLGYIRERVGPILELIYTEATIPYWISDGGGNLEVHRLPHSQGPHHGPPRGLMAFNEARG